VLLDQSCLHLVKWSINTHSFLISIVRLLLDVSVFQSCVSVKFVLIVVYHRLWIVHYGTSP